jgi:CheY-like chemotaxis protein
LDGLHVLVVEDEAAVALMLDDFLAERGAVVVGPVADAESALQLIAAERIDGAVVDYGLVGGTSLPVADALMARGVPFLFASGHDVGGIDPRYAKVPRLGKAYPVEELLRVFVDLFDGK